LLQPQQSSQKSILIEQVSSNTPKAERNLEKQASRLDIASQDRRFSEHTINSVKRLSIMERKSVNESQKAPEFQGTFTETPLEK